MLWNDVSGNGDQWDVKPRFVTAPSTISLGHTLILPPVTPIPPCLYFHLFSPASPISRTHTHSGGKDARAVTFQRDCSPSESIGGPGKGGTASALSGLIAHAEGAALARKMGAGFGPVGGGGRGGAPNLSPKPHARSKSRTPMKERGQNRKVPCDGEPGTGKVAWGAVKGAAQGQPGRGRGEIVREPSRQECSTGGRGRRRRGTGVLEVAAAVVCGVWEGDQMCMEAPVKGRKRCPAHKGKRVGARG